MWGVKDEAKPADLLNGTETHVAGRNGEQAMRGWFGWRDKKFGLRHATFRIAKDHPIEQIRQEIRNAELGGRESSGVQW